jgi:hypothetical protein
MVAVSESIPGKAWHGVPEDSSLNFDHYLDGTPKQY